MATGGTELTELLNASLAGDAGAAERVWRIVYEDVRGMAVGALLGERHAHELQPTQLVHEIFIRLNRSSPERWDCRRHYFGAVARALEQFLVEHARARISAKRGGNAIALPASILEDAQSTFDRADTAREIGLLDALTRLELEHSRCAEVARLRAVLGLTMEQIAEVVDASLSSVEKDWKFARAWLRRALEGR